MYTQEMDDYLAIDDSDWNAPEVTKDGERIKPYGAVEMLEDDEAHNGAPFEFDPRLTESQAVALKKALWYSTDKYWLPDADVKAEFTEAMILEVIDMAIQWTCDYPGFSLDNNDNLNEFVDVILMDVIPNYERQFGLISKE